MPIKEDSNKIVEAIKLADPDKYGFIVSLPERIDTFSDFK